MNASVFKDRPNRVHCVVHAVVLGVLLLLIACVVFRSRWSAVISKGQVDRDGAEVTRTTARRSKVLCSTEASRSRQETVCELLNCHVIQSLPLVVDNPVSGTCPQTLCDILEKCEIDVNKNGRCDLIPIMHVTGKDISAAVMQRLGLNSTQQYELVELQRDAIGCMEEYVGDLILDKFDRNIDAGVDHNDFSSVDRAPPQELNCLAAWNTTRGYLTEKGEFFSRTQRDPNRWHGLVTGGNESEEGLLKKARIALASQWGEHQVKAIHRNRIRNIFLSRPTRENLLRCLFNEAGLTFYVPHLRLEDLLDVIVMCKAKGIETVQSDDNIDAGGYPASAEDGRIMVGASETMTGEPPGQVSADHTAAIQKYYTTNHLHGMVLITTTIEANKHITNLALYVTLRANKKYFAIQMPLEVLVGDALSSAENMCFFDGELLWTVGPPGESIYNMKLPESDTAVSDRNIGDVMAESLHKADRSWYVSYRGERYAAYQFRQRHDSSGGLISNMCYVRLRDYAVVKVKETEVQSDHETSHIFLILGVYDRTAASERISLIEHFLKEKGGQDVTREVAAHRHPSGQ